VLTFRTAIANPAALGAVALSVALQLAALLIAPLADVLRLTPLGWQEWTVIVTLSVIPAVAGQLLKVMRQAQGGKRKLKRLINDQPLDIVRTGSGATRR
jgi:hypothetical protein